MIICRTSGELGLMGSLGGKKLMVTSAPTVLEVQLWNVRGGGADKGQRRGQRDESVGQMGGKGWVPCLLWNLGG